MYKITLISTLIPMLVFAAAPSMNLEYLTGGPFKSLGEEIVFQKNGTYTHTQREYSAMGSFTITGAAVKLVPGECHENVPGISIKKAPKVQCVPSLNMSCAIKETPGDLYFEHYLVCGASRYHSAAAVKSGSERKFKGISVVTMGMVNGVTTASVKIRETPSVTGKALTYAPEPYGPGQLLPAVPDKTPVTVIARTREKAKVQNWENYWYLVNVGPYNTAIEVWMFGEFVKMK